MSKVNAFDVIKKMSDDGNKNIRLAPLSNIIAVDQKGKKCTITVGVEAEDVKNYMLNKIGYGGLLLIDKEAYEATEKEIQAAPRQEEIWKAKAAKWDALGEKIAKYYPDGEEEEKFDDSEGLIGIGEAAATAFGYL